jgi:elongation factor Ts
MISADHSKGILVEVNCESDFVARTDDFQQLMRDVLTAIDQAGDRATEAWLKDPGGPVQQRVAAAIGKLGENIAVPRFVRYGGQGYVGQYIHLGGKIGVQVEVGGAPAAVAAREEFAALVREIAMQIAASSPLYLSRDAIPASVLESERAIYRAQVEGSGKPPHVIDKIVEGKLVGFYSQVVLPDQPSIRDTKMSVADAIAAATRTLGVPVAVRRFARLKVGESSV